MINKDTNTVILHEQGKSLKLYYSHLFCVQSANRGYDDVNVNNRTINQILFRVNQDRVNPISYRRIDSHMRQDHKQAALLLTMKMH